MNLNHKIGPLSMEACWENTYEETKYEYEYE